MQTTSINIHDPVPYHEAMDLKRFDILVVQNLPHIKHNITSFYKAEPHI